MEKIKEVTSEFLSKKTNLIVLGITALICLGYVIGYATVKLS